MPPENVQENYKNKLQGSEQLQSVSASFYKELNRDQVSPSDQILKKMVRQHLGETIRTRNFKAQNERIETEYWSTAIRYVSVKRKVGDCYQWKATGQCSKRDSCSF